MCHIQVYGDPGIRRGGRWDRAQGQQREINLKDLVGFYLEAKARIRP
jgi:hypothetical protein